MDLTPGPPDALATKKDTPTAFGRYAVRSALGAGGFGSCPWWLRGPRSQLAVPALELNQLMIVTA